MTNMTRGTDDALPILEIAPCAFYYSNFREEAESRTSLKNVSVHTSIYLAKITMSDTRSSLGRCGKNVNHSSEFSAGHYCAGSHTVMHSSGWVVADRAANCF